MGIYVIAINHDFCAARQPELAQRRREFSDVAPEVGVGDLAAVVDDRNGARTLSRVKCDVVCGH